MFCCCFTLVLCSASASARRSSCFGLPISRYTFDFIAARVTNKETKYTTATSLRRPTAQCSPAYDAKHATGGAAAADGLPDAAGNGEGAAAAGPKLGDARRLLPRRLPH